MDQDVWAESVIDMAINKDFLMGYGAGKASGGGGYIDRIQTIEGTLEDAFGYYKDSNAIFNSIINGSADAKITIDGTAIGIPVTITVPLYVDSPDVAAAMMVQANLNPTQITLAAVANWSFNGSKIEFFRFIVEQNGVATDLSQYASLMQTTLTIHWHMPQL